MAEVEPTRSLFWRKPVVGVLVSGILVTGLIAAALAFSRHQTDIYHERLDRIDTDLNQPIQLLAQAEDGFLTTQATIETVTATSSDQGAAAVLAQALTEGSTAKRRWAEFKARPTRLPEEQAARDAVDIAIAADDAAGQKLGIAVLAPTRDPIAVQQTAATQQASAAQVQASLERLDNDIYVPALGAQLTALADEASAAGGAVLAAMVIVVVLGVVLTALGYRRASRVEAEIAVERAQQDQVAAENALDARLQHALDMADNEPLVVGVIARAVARTDGGPPVDFLLAASTHGTFEHAVDDPDESGRCRVATPAECPAANHGKELVFLDSHALDACPHLVQRSVVPTAAVCTPVSIAGHAVGVIHECYLDQPPAPPHRVSELGIVARKAGERLGTIRAFARSETQAQTDPLTGLLNRRSLQEAVDRLERDTNDYSVAYADLDHFKVLNDTYGHDVGDRALRLFCTVLRSNVRPDDVVARYGGEEFVVVLPRCSPSEAVPVLRRVQQSLADTLRADGMAPFTVSIGIASAVHGGTFDEVLMLADGSLLRAKDDGRNRIVVNGVDEPVLGPEAPAPDDDR